MKNSHVCPVCAVGTLQSDEKAVTYQFGDISAEVAQFFHWCDACGTELALPEDVRSNARSYRCAELKHKGKLTSLDILAMRKQLNITQETAGKLFGGGPVAFCKYEKNDLAPSEPMDNLLWLVSKFPYLAGHLAERHHIDYRSPDIGAHIEVSTNRGRSSVSNSPTTRWSYFSHIAVSRAFDRVWDVTDEEVENITSLPDERWHGAKVPILHPVRGASVQAISDNDDMYALARKFSWQSKGLRATQ